MSEMSDKELDEKLGHIKIPMSSLFGEITRPPSPKEAVIKNWWYGSGQQGRTYIRSRDGHQWAWELFEPADGKYYVTDTGHTLHLSATCGSLWCSTNLITDETRTLVYRIMTRGVGAAISNGEGTEYIDRVCERCGPNLVRLY